MLARCGRTPRGSPTPPARRSHHSGAGRAWPDSAPPGLPRRQEPRATGATTRPSAEGTDVVSGPPLCALRQGRDRGVGDLDHRYGDSLHRQTDGEGGRVPHLPCHVAAVGAEEGGPGRSPLPRQLVGLTRVLAAPRDVIALAGLHPQTGHAGAVFPRRRARVNGRVPRAGGVAALLRGLDRVGPRGAGLDPVRRKAWQEIPEVAEQLGHGLGERAVGRHGVHELTTPRHATANTSLRTLTMLSATGAGVPESETI